MVTTLAGMVRSADGAVKTPFSSLTKPTAGLSLTSFSWTPTLTVVRVSIGLYIGRFVVALVGSSGSTWTVS